MVRPNDSKSKLSKKPKRSHRRKIQAPFYEALEARNLLAADLLVDLENAISLSDLQKSSTASLRGALATEPTATSRVAATHNYYVDGQAQGLVVLSDRIAVSRSATVLNSEQASQFLKYGLQQSRPLAGSDFTVYTSTSPIDQAFFNLALESGWANEVVPVFGTLEGQNEAVLLNEVIVRLPNGNDAATFFADSKYTSYQRLAGTPDQFVATLSAGYGPEALNVINEVGKDSRVTWAAPNFHQVWQKHYTPNDPRFGNLWGHNNTGALSAAIPSVADADSNVTEAWDFAPAGGASSVIVGILDDGVDVLHPDLNVYVGDVGVTDTNANGWIGDNSGWDFVNGNNTVAHTDAGDGHGTATAGIAAARGDNALGIAGVAYNSRSLSAQMFDGAGVATDANIASAMFYLAGRTFDGLGQWDSADVISHSWGGGAVSVAINDALTWTTVSAKGGNGVPTFFSSGNGGAAIGYPASQGSTNPGISVIGSFTNTAQGSSYHAFGAALDFLTPSNNFDPVNYLAIDTTDRSGADGYDPSDYTGVGTAGFGGTSAAAPFAAGIAALAQARANALSVTLTGANYRALMRNNTKLMEATAIGGYSTLTGHNLLNGYGAADAASLMDGIGQARISATTATAELVSASTTNLGTAFVSQTVDFRIRIRNQGTSTLNLTSLTASGTDYTISEAPGDTALSLGESTSFVVRVIPTAAGLRAGSVTIASNDSSLPSMVLNLEVTAAAPDAAGYVFEDRNGNGTREAGENALANHFVFADANANSTFDQTPAAPAVGGSIGIADNTENIGTQVVSGLGDFITDVNVTLNITHTWVADMGIILEAPNGQQVLLFNQRGGSGDNLVNTVFDDSAANSIGDVTSVAPFTGSFRPETPLSLYSGQPGAAFNGTWTLRVFDVATGDTGTVTDWTLNISTGEANDFTDALGFYVMDGFANGSYSARYAQAGWTPSGVASHPFTIASPASTFTGFNFGVGRNNRFYAHVFNDLDADGTVDGGEGPRAGRKIFIDTNNNSIDDAPTTTNINAAPGTALPDNITVDVPVTVAGITGNITDIDLTINFTHTWMSDVEMTLIAPDGVTQAIFFDNHGGSGDNITGTVFNDEAATLISAGTAPFTGSFRPFQAFTIFDGLTPAQANGNWTIRMSDNATGDTGVLVDYTLKIDHGIDEADALTGADGWVNFDLSAGAQNMRLVAPGGGFVFTVPVNGLRTPTVAGAPLFNQTYGERTPPSTTLVSRNVFYKGGTIAGAPASLFPTNKVIAKQGPTAQTMTYANVINHTRGINGMVFDYNGLPGGALNNSDFVFQWSPQGGFDATLPANQPAAWAAAPNPSAISNTLLSGSTRRIQLEWTDGSIVDRWIRVTVNANANTGLGTPDVFYLGHKAGEVNGQITNIGGTQPFGRFTVTNAGDVIPIRAALNQSGLTADSFTDLNKSGNVNNAGDVIPVRGALNSQLTIIQTPAAPAPNFGGNGSISGGRSNIGGRSNSDALGLIFGGVDQVGGKIEMGAESSTPDSTRIIDDVFAGFESQLIGNSINLDLGQNDVSSNKDKKSSAAMVSNDLVDLFVEI